MAVGVEFPNYLKSGELARLIPVLADSKKEQRITASVLSSFMAVPQLAQSLFSVVGAPVRKKAQIICLTEVVFNDSSNARLPRPDGLIIVRSGKTEWSALVEAKIGKSNLEREQVEEYLILAKKFGINALITFSNQFSVLPTHHPLEIPTSKLRGVELFHFSWMSMLSRAQLLSDDGSLVDPEQAFIVRELIRYLQHDSSGVLSFNNMGKKWRDVCTKIQSGTKFRRNDNDLNETVSNWHELVRYLSLELTSSIGRPVDVVVSRNHTKDPSKRLSDDIEKLTEKNLLEAAFFVPDAASHIVFSADFLRRTLNISMRLSVPSVSAKATTCINHFTKQLKMHPKPDELIVRVHWPGRASETDANLTQALGDPKILLHDNQKTQPKHVEFIAVQDLAGKFSSSQKFVEFANAALHAFYDLVGQNIKPWNVAPPKLKKRNDIDASLTSEDKDGQQADIEGDPMPDDEMTKNSAIKDHDSSFRNQQERRKLDDILSIPSFLIRRKMN